MCLLYTITFIPMISIKKTVFLVCVHVISSCVVTLCHGPVFDKNICSYRIPGSHNEGK